MWVGATNKKNDLGSLLSLSILKYLQWAELGSNLPNL